MRLEWREPLGKSYCRHEDTHITPREGETVNLWGELWKVRKVEWIPQKDIVVAHLIEYYPRAY